PPRRPRRRPPPPPFAIAIAISAAPGFELAAEDGRELVGKAFETAGQLVRVARELVVGDNRRDSGEQANRRSEQRFGDGTGDHGEIGARRRGNGGEGVHNAPYRAKEADKGRGRAD